MPAIGCLLLPTDVLRVFPQQLHLIGRVSGVPQAVSQELAWSGFAVDELNLNAGFSISWERMFVPVLLRVAFPSHSVESAVALIAENEADIIVVHFSVNEQSSFKVNVRERIVANRETRIRIESLHHLSTFVVNKPTRIFLVVADWIKSNSLEGSEVGRNDLVVVRTNIVEIHDHIAIEIIVTGVSNAVVVGVQLIDIL